MKRLTKLFLCALPLGLTPQTLVAQTTPAIPVSTTAPAGKARAAALVNGREIPETSLERALKPVAKENKDKARTDILNFLIDNALVDQYLELLKVSVDPKDVDAQLETFKGEVKKADQDYAKVLEKMEITEADLKKEIHNQLRWDKFVAMQATDEKLKKLFENSPEIFDGSTVRAKHILITPETPDEKGKAAALKKIQEIKLAVEKTIAEDTAKLPALGNNLAQQKAVNKITEDAFSAAAKEQSSCPSKRDGGDLGEFPRMGSMVEPFAKTAFALKTFQISEPVSTQFGYHLIMVTGRKPGEPTKFETVKGAVVEVYGSKLKEAVVEKMKSDPNTKIEIMK
ncbi:peptidylprolyl isomerase [Zavarzinella formosa]|uniref:peptidylprolyl isomerase n=1 Tax=Zavarzinella formosa TaxID=360055 RepID=UPI0003077F0B|nr:peptidylprolyl isomerase [Zavarzinella formosa]